MEKVQWTSATNGKILLQWIKWWKYIWCTLSSCKNICDTFNIANLGDYHDLYVSLDVALLSDVFENFRDTSINIDKLDPAYYLSVPGLS